MKVERLTYLSALIRGMDKWPFHTKRHSDLGDTCHHLQMTCDIFFFHINVYITLSLPRAFAKH